jgi:hypothetical protein
MIRTLAAVQLFACVVLAQTPSPLKEATVYGSPAVLISNDKLELAVAARGGSMNRLVLRGDPEALSPFGNPERFNTQPPRKPLSVLGHFLCADGFGPASAEERKAGLPMHGEAHVLPWGPAVSGKLGGVAAVTFSVKLPLVQETLTRTIQVVDGENVIYVDSEFQSHLGFDRPLNWGEHLTLGAPFLEPENTVVDMSGSRSKTRIYPDEPAQSRRRLASFLDFTWPAAPGKDGSRVDLRGVPPKPDSLDHTTTLMDPSRTYAWVTALNTSRHYLLGYIFRREDFPWVQNWMNYPATLWLQRGVEFATQPFDVPRREAVTLNSLFDAPTYRWLPAMSRISARFLLFYVQTPADMSRIDDVRLEGGKIIVEDRAAGKRLELPASLPL